MIIRYDVKARYQIEEIFQYEKVTSVLKPL